MEFIKQEQLEDEAREYLSEYANSDNKPDTSLYETQSSHSSVQGQTESPSCVSGTVEMELIHGGFPILMPLQIKALKRKEVNDYAINCSAELEKFRNNQQQQLNQQQLNQQLEEVNQQLEASTLIQQQLNQQLQAMTVDRDRLQGVRDQERLHFNGLIQQLQLNPNHGGANNQLVPFRPRGPGGFSQ